MWIQGARAGVQRYLLYGSMLILDNAKQQSGRFTLSPQSYPESPVDTGVDAKRCAEAPFCSIEMAR